MFNFSKNLVKVFVLDAKSDNLVDKLSISWGADSEPLFIASIKSETAFLAFDDISDINPKSFFRIGESWLNPVFESFKKLFISDDKFLELVIVSFIRGISFCMSLIISDTLSVASTAVSTTLSISLNLPCTSTKLFSKVDSLGNCFSISIPASLNAFKTTSLTVLTTVWFTSFWIVVAPLLVILGAIAFIFSFTVYIIVPFFISLETKEAKFSEKFEGISMYA